MFRNKKMDGVVIVYFEEGLYSVGLLQVPGNTVTAFFIPIRSDKHFSFNTLVLFSLHVLIIY